MRAVIKSVSPRICKKVASGDYTILVSKAAPKCEVPFKCYIYCTKQMPLLGFHTECVDGSLKKIYTNHLFGRVPYFNGKVIGEFVCDEIIEWQYTTAHKYYVDYPDDCTSYFPYLKCHSEATGLKCSEIENYGKGKPLYGWHISDLKIYDKPRELSEFRITRPPQGWCYVEEIEQ